MAELVTTWTVSGSAEASRAPYKSRFHNWGRCSGRNPVQNPNHRESCRTRCRSDQGTVALPGTDQCSSLSVCLGLCSAGLREDCPRHMAGLTISMEFYQVWPYISVIRERFYIWQSVWSVASFLFYVMRLVMKVPGQYLSIRNFKRRILPIWPTIGASPFAHRFPFSIG
jgi:hypothetical protein